MSATESLAYPLTYAKQLREKQGSWVPTIVLTGAASMMAALAAITLYQSETIEVTMTAMGATLMGYSAYIYFRPARWRV